MRIRGAHDGGQNSGQANACYDRMKQGLDHDNEYLLRIRASQWDIQIADTCKANERASGERQKHPSHCDASGLRHIFSGLDGLESGQDMRLSKLTQAPAKE